MGSLCLRSARHLCGVVLLPRPTRWEAAVRSYHVPLPLTPSSFCAHLTILACWGRGQHSHGSPNRTPFSDLVSEKLKSDCAGVSGGPPARSRGKKGNGTDGADAVSLSRELEGVCRRQAGSVRQGRHPGVGVLSESAG